MHGPTRTDGTTDERSTDERPTDEYPGGPVLGELLTAGREATDAPPPDAEPVRPLVRHSSDLLDLVAGGVPFAVAHDVRAASVPRSPRTEPAREPRRESGTDPGADRPGAHGSGRDR